MFEKNLSFMTDEETRYEFHHDNFVALFFL